MILKYRLFCWFLFVGCSSIMYAQDTLQATQFLETARLRIDSLSHKEAITLSDQAIKIYESIDPQFYQLGYAYNIKGEAWYELQQNDKAIAYFLNAKDILEAHFKVPNVELAQSINFLGLCYWRKGNLDQAVDYFQEALDMRLQLFGEQHPKVADSYNNLGNISFAQGALGDALGFYQRAFGIRLNIFGSDHLDVASSLNNMGTCYVQAGEYKEALKCYQPSLQIREKQLAVNHPKIAQSHLNIGDCHLQMGHIEEAIADFNQSLFINQAHPKLNEVEIAKVYNYLGSSYSQMGNQAKAISFFEKSLAIQLTYYQEDSPNLVGVYNNFANAFEKQGDYQKALVYYQNNLHILSTNPSYGLQHPLTAITYNNIGQTQEKFSDFREAINSHLQALNIFQTRQDQAQIAETLRQIGNIFLDVGDYSSAIQNYTTSLELLKKMGRSAEVSTAYIFQNLGIGFYNQEKYDLALTNYQKALQLIQYHFGEHHESIIPFKTNIGSALQKKGEYKAALKIFEELLIVLKIVPTADLPDFIELPMETLQLLLAKGNTHLNLYQKAQDVEVLKAALSIFDYAIRLTPKIREQYQEVQSKIALGEISYDNFAAGIETCYLLYEATKEEQYLIQAFAYSEQSRSNLVVEALNTSVATSFSGIPDTLIQQEKELKIAITFNEKKKRKAIQKGAVDAQDLINELNNKIFALKKELAELLNRFENEFPQYFQLKYSTTSPTIKTIQNDLLAPDHSLVEYFVADTTTFVFVVNKETITLTPIAIAADSLAKQVSQLRKSIHAYYTDTNQQTSDSYLKALSDYTFEGYDLYQKIIQPIAHQLAVKVTIINGGILNFLPFEALIASPAKQVHKPKSYDYLVKNYEISYGYSANLLHRILKNDQTKYTKGLLAFAPVFEDNDPRNLAPLVHNIPEVTGIHSLVGGDIFTGGAANKAQFENLAGLYQIIHLSTHGQSDMVQGDYSYLAFATAIDSTQEDLLYAKDIYNLSLNADMVVLSACETGKGEASRSEGAISLGRAFFYSGAKSILNTLWNVDDASTGQLMKQFYTDIRDGFEKSTALRKVKLQFIEEGQYAHPYYWSAFMLIGNRDRLDIMDTFPWENVLGLSFVILLAGVSYKYYRRKKHI